MRTLANPTWRWPLAATAAVSLLGGCADDVSLDAPAPVVALTTHTVNAARAATPAPAQPTAAASSSDAAVAEPLALDSPAMEPSAAASAPAMPASMAKPAAPVATTRAHGAGLTGQRFVCADGSAFLASFDDTSVTLVTALAQVRLPQTLSADGARYASGTLEVWFKGEQVTVGRDGTQQTCNAAP